MRKRYALTTLISLVPFSALADHTTVGLQGNVKGPNTTSSASLMDAGQTGFSVQYQYIDFKSIDHTDFAHASEHDESVHGTDTISSTSFNFTWGFSDRLTFGISVPRIERRGLVEAAHHHDEEDEHEEEQHEAEEADHEEESVIERLGTASGIGDTRLFANYQLWTNTQSSASLLFGVKAPTGEDDEISRAGHLLESEFQPGTGSWDSMLGMAYSRQLSDWTFDANILYSFATEGSQHTDLGDIFNYNLALSHPLPDINLFGNSSWQTAFLFEMNGEWRDQLEIHGISEHNSGGNIVYFAPGVTLSNDDWFLSASISKAVEDLDGIQSEPNMRFIFSFGRSF